MIVGLSLEAYEEARRLPRRFFVAPGHEVRSVSNGAAVVAERKQGYLLVDKIGEAGEIAQETYQELEARGQ